MEKITIDTEKCVKCGICSTVCPVSIIGKDINEWPAVITDKKNLCISCGHCEIHCPHGALSLLYDFIPEDVPQFNKVSIPPKDFELYLKNRRSVRQFKSKSTDRHDIEQIMDMVRYAPTGKNFQHVQYTIIHDTKKLGQVLDAFYAWMKELSLGTSPLKKMIPIETAFKLREKGNEIILRGAPHLIIAHVPESGPMGQAASYDAIIALSHFDIIISSFGMGGFWAGFFTMGLRNSAELRKAAMIPDGSMAGYAYAFGIPQFEHYAFPKRKKASISWM
jgi:nitroreductase/NAD-dependent dihydropyrimidine dehydrogenase PreA subunit